MWKTDKNRVKSGLQTVDNYVDGVDSIVNIHKIVQNNYAWASRIRVVNRLAILHGAGSRAATYAAGTRRLCPARIPIIFARVHPSNTLSRPFETKKPPNRTAERSDSEQR